MIRFQVPWLLDFRCQGCCSEDGRQGATREAAPPMQWTSRASTGFPSAALVGIVGLSSCARLSFLPAHSPICHAGQIGHVLFPGGQIVQVETTQAMVAACAGEHFHEVDGGRQIGLESTCRLLDDQSGPQARLLIL